MAASTAMTIATMPAILIPFLVIAIFPPSAPTGTISDMHRQDKRFRPWRLAACVALASVREESIPADHATDHHYPCLKSLKAYSEGRLEIWRGRGSVDACELNNAKTSL